jgi:hypothetical protein
VHRTDVGDRLRGQLLEPGREQFGLSPGVAVGIPPRILDEPPELWFAEVLRGLRLSRRLRRLRRSSRRSGIGRRGGRGGLIGAPRQPGQRDERECPSPR